ncbi:transposase [Salinimicrobium profundisediminis]|uniref:transposase n=1 Tax=Salinimicrobium profundisediminis TaxID=2994553 RepID=UPI003521E286
MAFKFQFSVEELSSFLQQIQKRGFEKIHKGKPDGLLNYERNQKIGSGNTRNGFTQKKVRSSYGEDIIKVRQDEYGSFNPVIGPKRQNTLLTVSKMSMNRCTPKE